MCFELKSEFCVFYLDDGTLGGYWKDVLHDLEVVSKVGLTLGLQLNHNKSEVISKDAATLKLVLSSSPELHITDHKDASMLGSPIGDSDSVSICISAKVKFLKTMGERLHHLDSHDALLLLRHSFAIPKLTYLLRTSPCFLSSKLCDFDNTLKSILSHSLNLQFMDSDPAWVQAQLPITLGGLGIHSAVQLAPSAFLASAAGASNMVLLLLPQRLSTASIPAVDLALSLWSVGHQVTPPLHPASFSQKAWDFPRVQAVAQDLLNSAPDAVTRARLLATSTPDSGAWLNAFPLTSVGLRMDNDTVRIAVGLRLGIPLCHPHLCHHCGTLVSNLATHGLSCRRSEGRHFRHASLNNIIWRSLVSAKVPARLEPSDVFRSDGKRPDGITLVPWESGKLLIWDATCCDTLAPSYLPIASSESRAVAAEAERRKVLKYAQLSKSYLFIPLAFETLGAIGSESLVFLKELGHRLHKATGDPQSFQFLLQRLSVAIQRGNAAAVLGSIGPLPDLDNE